MRIIKAILIIFLMASCQIFTPDEADSKKASLATETDKNRKMNMKPSVFEGYLYDIEKKEYPRDVNYDNSGVPEWYPQDVGYGAIMEAKNKFFEFRQMYDQESSNPFTNPFFGRINKTVSLNPYISIVEERDSIYMDNVFKEALSRFVCTWWVLFSDQEFMIDDIEIDPEKKMAYLYIKEFYNYPIVDPERYNYYQPTIGRIRIGFDDDGKLKSMNSNLLPQLKVPVHPIYTRSAVKSLLEGYEYIWWFSSSSYYTHVIEQSDIKSLELTIYLDWGGEEHLKYRLAWKMVSYPINISGNPNDETMKLYVDALTGEMIW